MTEHVWIVAVMLVALVGGESAGPGPEALARRDEPVRCKISEYECSNKRCVPANRYCDNVNDCGDSSDEPRHCTPCNRTYYGDVGRTYDLELHRPKEDRLPYVCHLTLTADGGMHGDLIQLTLESFTLGRFVSFTADGCPDGSLQIAEKGRPPMGGSWCGSAWGPAVYYSETRSLVLSVRLLRLSKDQNGYNFDFRIQYKVLSKELAVVRYGGPPFPDDSADTYYDRLPPPPPLGPYGNANNTARPPYGYLPPAPRQEYYLGDLISSTYCSRIFSDCDRKVCRLQSPNFPGVYPRNLTCYYAVRQHEVPPGKHALIIVRQKKGQLVSIRSQSALYAATAQQQQQQQQQLPHTRTLRVWNECDEVQDYVTIYDGYTTRDPVILKFCGGGESVPEAVSSGPELLVEFTTSPYGTFLYPTPIQTLHGFQLEVEVKFVDQQSPTYAKNKRACEFWIRGTGKGVLESPQHSLSPNTTCLYHLQGIDIDTLSMSPGSVRPIGQYSWRRAGFSYPPPRFKVWLSVLKFYVSSVLGPLLPEEEACSSYLNVWDGPLRIPPGCSDIFCDRERWKVTRSGVGVSVGKPPGNATLVARFCRNHGGPTSGTRSCEHALLRPKVRPCTPSESFLSTGDTVTLELRLADSTSLKPVKFKALYEFVDLQQDGEPFGSGSCSRRFFSRSTDITTEPSQRFSAPKDVFLYGRGGARNLSCKYRFEGQRGERVKITITALKITGSRSGRCTTRESALTSKMACLGRAKATLRTFDVPWPGKPALLRDCLCSSAGVSLPFTFVSGVNVAEVRFEATNMSAVDDYKNIYFEGSYEFIKTPTCNRDRKLSGSSGIVRFDERDADRDECEGHPWLVEPRDGHYLFVSANGIRMREPVIDEYNLSHHNLTVLHDDKDNCLTKDRIVIYPGNLAPVVVCPAPVSQYRDRSVQVFSEGWPLSKYFKDLAQSPTSAVEHSRRDESRTIAVEFLGRERGSHAASWLELTRSSGEEMMELFPWFGTAEGQCRQRCPELGACIDAALWCDGAQHCPSGYDESLAHCSWLLQLPPPYLAALFVASAACASMCVVWVARRRRRRRRSTAFQRRLESMSSDTAVFGDKEVIC